jgi:hypothetical protein
MELHFHSSWVASGMKSLAVIYYSNTRMAVQKKTEIEENIEYTETCQGSDVGHNVVWN